MTNLHNSSEEIWKEVKDFEGRYFISNSGRLRSINGTNKGETILACYLDSTGYYSATLRKVPLKRKVRIHTLVAEHFLINPHLTVRQTVNHIDGNKLNNHVSNLEWISAKENVVHATKMGLNKTRHAYMSLAKKIIDTSTGEVYESIAEAGRKTGIPWKRLSNYLCGYRKNVTTLRYA